MSETASEMAERENGKQRCRELGIDEQAINVLFPTPRLSRDALRAAFDGMDGSPCVVTADPETSRCKYCDAGPDEDCVHRGEREVGKQACRDLGIPECGINLLFPTPRTSRGALRRALEPERGSIAWEERGSLDDELGCKPEGRFIDELPTRYAEELEATYRRPAQRYSDEEERAYLREFWGKRPREDAFIDGVPPAYEVRSLVDSPPVETL